MSSRTVEYTDDQGEMDGIGPRVLDMLPPPDQLVLRDDGQKVTLTLSRHSVDFFKREAARQRVSYQRMIRALLDEYARRQVVSRTSIENTPQSLGLRRAGVGRLEQAVEAYRAALLERTRERVPLEWAETLNSLGNALALLGQLEASTAQLEQAVEAYRAALSERTRERVPLEWAETLSNLGAALSALGQHESGTFHLEEAVAACRAALEVYEAEGTSYYAERTRRNLARTQSLLHERELAVQGMGSDQGS